MDFYFSKITLCNLYTILRKYKIRKYTKLEAITYQNPFYPFDFSEANPKGD